MRELRDRSGRLSEDLRLVPFDVPELRHGATGDWWALGELEGSVRNPDGSVATLRSNQRVRPDERLVNAVRQMCGADAVEVVR